MKNIATFPVLAIVLASALTLAGDTSRTDKEAEQHFEKANELLKRMDYESAIAEYSKVINLSSGSKVAQDAQYWIGQSHLRAGQFDAAQAAFAKLIEQYPTSAIVPVTKLMVQRVGQAKKNEEKRRAMSNAAEKGFVIDPYAGVRYTKTASFTGRNDVIEDTTYPTRQGCLRLSPNGKFLLYGKLVVPLDGSESFDLVDVPATHCIWSPDERKVAFYSGEAICIVPVSPETGRPTGPVRKLLDGNYRFQTKASWSPDSEKLAFMSTLNKDKGIYGGDIWALSVKDGSLTQITNDRDAREGAPAWSPDGKTIAYGKKDRYKGRYSLCLISAEGGAPRKIIEPGEMFFPFWSPDGKWILYTLGEEIHIFGLNDNQELEIIPPEEVVGHFFSWSPDGKKMLFYRPSYGYKYDIKVVSASGGPPFDLGRQVMLYPEHVWSPDSKMIVAEGENEDGRYGKWVSPLSGGDPALLEMDVSVEGSPFPISVSPNVEKLAFSADRDDGTEDLFVVPISLQDARTTGPAVKVFDGLFRGLGTNVTTSWSPDGNKIAVIHRWDVWIASSNGDKPVQITKTPEMEIWPGWSPDGKMVSYEIRSQDLRPLYVVPASGGKATKILDVPGNDKYAYGWSPDSKKLAFDSEGLISVVSVADGETKQVANLKDLGLERVFYFSWSPDGKHIACVGDHIEKGDAGPIFIIPIEGGKVTTLVANDSSSKYLLHWSPDGRWISYNSEGPVKVRPEGTMWEADFDEIVKSASR
ncbi:MAG: DPP IV N-terminal domain-containing protein [Planctomycetota bacterium]|jgi:Tol biopolymer transport system component